jgi:pyridoxal phosphate enzyme (YggS family)
MAAACARAGRAPGEVSLLPVSKTFPATLLREAVTLGLHRFAENRPQELRDKSRELADLPLQWVLIGQLQTNKVKDVARHACEVQSLDRLALAEALDARMQAEGRAMDVLVQVKTSSEESKSGLPPQELPAFMQALRGMSSLRVQGLMTLAVLSEDEQAVRACFRDLRLWRDRLRQAGFESVTRLSMGMSSDFEIAIEEGATEIRVGSALFGQR